MNPRTSSRSRTSTEAADRRLRAAVRWACWWLAAQGLLNLVMGERLAYWLHLRFQLTMLPYLRQSGVALLALALLLARGVQEPRRQTLSVDVLLLALVGQIFTALSFRLSVDRLLPLEWGALAVNAVLAGLVLRDRSRSSQYQETGALLGQPAKDWLRSLGPKALRTARPAKPARELPFDLEALPLPADLSSRFAPAAPEAPPAELPPPPVPAAPWMDHSVPVVAVPKALEEAPIPQVAVASVPPPPPSAPAAGQAPLPPPLPGARFTPADGKSKAVPHLD